MGPPPCRPSLARWPAVFILLLAPLVARAEGSSTVASVDTEHIFGFTDGTDIGSKGDVELEGTFFGSFGRPGHFAAVQNETAVRYGVTENFRLSGGALFDYRSISNVPGVDDYSSVNFSGLTGEAIWQVSRRAPVGVTLSVSPQWRRLGDLSDQSVDSYLIGLRLLADTIVIPDSTFAAVNLIAVPMTTGQSGAWRQEISTEASAAISHAVRRGVFVGAEMRHLTHNHEGLFTGHALFVGPSVFVKASETMSIKASWSMQVPDECSGVVDLVNYERHQALLVLVKEF